MIVITVLVVGVLGASVGLASKQAPQKCGYARDNGLYWSTYGGPLQRAVVPAPDLGLLDNILSFPWIAGVAHYQNFSALEPSDPEQPGGERNWTVLDSVFAAAARHNKSVILGLQMGVAAPAWLLTRADVRTVQFVHANPGWFPWATVQSHVAGVPVITMASPWHNPVYEVAVARTVAAVAERYADHPSLAWANVAGLSASGGVEANFNVDFARSRTVIPRFDAQMNYTARSYIDGWRSRIDLYWRLFRGRIGMATHNQPGAAGWDSTAGKVVSYSEPEQMTTARAVRDHLVALGQSNPVRPTPVIRCCGGSNRTGMWGVPNVTVGPGQPPPLPYAQLMWEVRNKAAIGFEQGGIVGRGRGQNATTLRRCLTIEQYYNARYIELKTPDVINSAGGQIPSKQPPYQPSVIDLVAAASRMKGCCLPWGCPAS